MTFDRAVIEDPPAAMRGVVRRIGIVFGLILATYVAVFFFILITQRSLIFHPTALGTASPADYHVPFTKLEIPSAHGEKVYAWWIERPDPKNSPTVVYCHGNGAALSMLNKVSSIFYNLGWNALLFDYRGYGSSDQASEGLSEESMAADADAAYRWALERFPEQKVFIWGHSLGSSVAARLASRHHPAGLVLEGSFPSMFTMATQRYPYYPIFHFMLFDRFDTESYLKGHTFPILLLHAERDMIVPLFDGQALFRALTGPKQWLLIKGVGHNDFPEVHQAYDGELKTIVSGWTGLPNS